MSTPNSRAAVDNSGSANHLLSEQIDQQQGCIAFRAVTAQANGASKELAVWAAALAAASGERPEQLDLAPAPAY